MIAVYKNGNAIVKINLENGTKERQTKDDDFNLEFPESIDLNIGNRCDGGCQYCYINASPEGVDANLFKYDFINSIHPFTEVAINGNSLEHKQLIPFLETLKKKKIIANITVNQIHFERNLFYIDELVQKNLVKGIGVSLRSATPDFIKTVKKYPNIIIHVVNGIVTDKDFEILRDNNLKLLILGYKDLGRGVKYKDDNNMIVNIRQKYLYDILDTLPYHFQVVAMDNLAIKQLKPQRFISKKEWDTIYMGDEGTSSMFIDLVDEKFGVSSLCSPEEMHPLLGTVKEMFDIVRKEAKAS